MFNRKLIKELQERINLLSNTLVDKCSEVIEGTCERRAMMGEISSLERALCRKNDDLDKLKNEFEAYKRKEVSEAVIAKNRFIIVPMTSGDRGEGKTIFSLRENHLTPNSCVERLLVGSFATKAKAKHHLNEILKYEEDYK